MMKKLFVASLILSLSGAVLAAEPTVQQSKMKTCNVDATGKKGDERKAFMKQCLSAKPAAAAAAPASAPAPAAAPASAAAPAIAAAPAPKLTQQDKMKKCNADATGKKGDERKGFMKECLSKKS